MQFWMHRCRFCDRNSFLLHIQVTYHVSQKASMSPDELPRTVASIIHQGSTVISMDFHPSHQTLLASKINANNTGSHNLRENR